MANTFQDFEIVFVSDADVSLAHPEWSLQAVEDYQSIKRNLTITSSVADQSFDDSDAVMFNMFIQQLTTQPLTSDETGFTVDSAALTVDMTQT